MVIQVRLGRSNPALRGTAHRTLRTLAYEGQIQISLPDVGCTEASRLRENKMIPARRLRWGMNAQIAFGKCRPAARRDMERQNSSNVGLEVSCRWTAHGAQTQH